MCVRACNSWLLMCGVKQDAIIGIPCITSPSLQPWPAWWQAPYTTHPHTHKDLQVPPGVLHHLGRLQCWHEGPPQAMPAVLQVPGCQHQGLLRGLWQAQQRAGHREPVLQELPWWVYAQAHTHTHTHTHTTHTHTHTHFLRCHAPSVIVLEKSMQLGSVLRPKVFPLLHDRSPQVGIPRVKWGVCPSNEYNADVVCPILHAPQHCSDWAHNICSLESKEQELWMSFWQMAFLPDLWWRLCQLHLRYLAHHPHPPSHHWRPSAPHMFVEWAKSWKEFVPHWTSYLSMVSPPPEAR